ncbi:SigE family RNA polymerase sigma factor [Embleya sp. NBC_00896]|uniref:SigE family RNA polymerase sigma factor n=1 Tax=Embleya sp. NBC_00896 TaxID=2975961 RepID=UPI003867FDAA|nr:SigE family RNA polymerase sigma factor [Embleya sp. NBC_00896]
MERDAEFTRFAHAVYPRMLRTALLLTADRDIAQDLTQTALLRVYSAWPRHQAWADPAAYARRVLVNVHGSWWRRRWRGETPHGVLPDEAGPDPARGWSERVDLARALAALPSEQRVVLVLRFYEDLSVAETAELIGCSTGTVKSRTARGLAQLKSRAGLDTERKENNA